MSKIAAAPRSWPGFLGQYRVRLALTLLSLLVLLTILAPWLSPYPAAGVDLSIRHQPPSWQHWLGTDGSGRDVATRLLYGGRVSLLVGAGTAITAAVLGTAVGLLSGYFGGWVDAALTRVVEILLSFPYFALALTLAALLPPGLISTILIISSLGWLSLARIVRAETAALKKKEFVEAAAAAGLGSLTIIRRQILPHLRSPILVSTSVAVARGILAETAISFLGLGVQIPTPSWGNMLASAQNLITFSTRWWQWLPPGLLIVATTLAVNLLAHGLRESFDVRASLRRIW